MTLQVFILFAFGMLAELILLGQYRLDRPPLMSGTSPLLARLQQPSRMLIVALALFAGLCLLIARLTGSAEMRVYIDTPIINILFIFLGVFVFFAAMAANIFLPLVNEQTILVVQGLVLYYAFSGGSAVAFMPLAVLASVPALVSLGLILWRRPVPASFKALLYLWYLLTLMVIPFQSNQVAYFRRNDLTLLEGAFFGSLLVFLIIHGLFTVRFFLITSSLVLPRNRALVERVMPLLFSDEQVPLGRLAFTTGLLAALILINRALGLLPEGAILSLGVMFAVQFLSQRKTPEKV